MKTFPKFLLLTICCFLTACDNEDGQGDIANLPAQNFANVAYGNQTGQIMDVYLPANRTSSTKVFVLIHGGGWSGGSKADMSSTVPFLQAYFPTYAVVNLEYRLGTAESPGYTKQLDDIEAALQFLRDSDYQVSDDYGLIGASAGAHLSMLYAYGFDEPHRVKAVCSIVGPADFTDPNYFENPVFQYGLVPLVGNVTYEQNPALFAQVSPISHVSASSPATIQFMGGQDPLVPATQGPRLKTRLDSFGVYNELNLYPEGGHGDWDQVTSLDFATKLVAFFQAKF